jgi:hypothetical protein
MNLDLVSGPTDAWLGAEDGEVFFRQVAAQSPLGEAGHLVWNSEVQAVNLHG